MPQNPHAEFQRLHRHALVDGVEKPAITEICRQLHGHEAVAVDADLRQPLAVRTTRTQIGHDTTLGVAQRRMDGRGEKAEFRRWLIERFIEETGAREIFEPRQHGIELGVWWIGNAWVPIRSTIAASRAIALSSFTSAPWPAVPFAVSLTRASPFSAAASG
ncbi:hypothetical protein [Ancylobacter amanitiformis]|uniref:Bro-N domain-containing protein n=1 Tax=Ancylobacter amanitiformis TaxID=217069 RepID=A0ABU0LUD7_9HYPH|nr:hypothetical protein [Ancylobacter amanitiformis]MDQ0512285.1 hypothetical protein [Ancylobacter amanitiformis]